MVHAIQAAVFLIIRSVYLLFFHSLSKVPGPRHYAVTDVFYLYHWIIGDWHTMLKGFHDKYGPIVRFGPYDISTISPESWKIIYGHKTDSSRTFDKDLRSQTETISGTPHIIMANNEDHKRMRRTMAHAFSEKALRGQEDVIQRYTSLLLSKLSEKAAKGEAVDLVAWYNYTTFDLIGDLSFGKPFGCLESGQYSPLIAMIFGTIRKQPFPHALNRYPYLKPIARLFTSKRHAQDAISLFQLSHEVAMQRVKSGNTEREDFMSYILRNNGRGKEQELSNEEISENAVILIAAGSETTATQLSGTTFQLLTNRDKYDTLVAHIRDTFSSADKIDIVSVNQIDYLLATFSEGFRMYPPVPSHLPRIVPEGGETIDGHSIPAKTSASVPQWAAFQSSQNFYEPQRFVPERWLPNAPPCFANDNREVLQPFSFGPRNCIGKNLAYAEMRLILTRLLYSFDLELLPQSSNWSDQKMFLLWDKGEMMVKLTPRPAPALV
ncbi:cytochrome P450 [Microdochium bolleyi]|uniref:Cytochrome P450 n=1 Tax=Microdochium bolleyi TaxID=196109 RepID=A0A136IJ52_9PEZI|nr:cytochrome P450 [Microdochium bolleyi]